MSTDADGEIKFSPQAAAELAKLGDSKERKIDTETGYEDPLWCPDCKVVKPTFEEQVFGDREYDIARCSLCNKYLLAARVVDMDSDEVPQVIKDLAKDVEDQLLKNQEKDNQ